MREKANYNGSIASSERRDLTCHAGWKGCGGLLCPPLHSFYCACAAIDPHTTTSFPGWVAAGSIDRPIISICGVEPSNPVLAHRLHI